MREREQEACQSSGPSLALEVLSCVLGRRTAYASGKWHSMATAQSLNRAASRGRRSSRPTGTDLYPRSR